MSFTGDHECDRCKKAITGNTVILNFEGHSGLTEFKDGLDFCSDCFSAFLEWFKHPEPKKLGSTGFSEPKLGPVERVAKRENLDLRELGPVERVARRVDDK